jgi:glycosyltransferase involved in cell wall biosynthesis
MRVGIYTHYAHCDQAYLAIRLTKLLRKLGIEFDIYSDDQAGKLGVACDRAVLTRDVIKFTDWAKRQRVIVWTHVPPVEQISYAKRKKIKTVIAPMWQDMVQPFKKALKTADHVVTMSSECHTLFSEIYHVRSAEYIPFDPGLPIIKKTEWVNPRKIRILLPWFDRNAKCSSGHFIASLKFLLEHMEEAHLTLAITPSQFSPSIVKFFQTVSKNCPGRLQILRGVPISKRPQLYAQHDLTLSPAECDNYGLCALTSLAMGTPVLTTAIPPQTDFLFADNNAILVPSEIDYDENGVLHALPDYDKFVYVLQEVIAEPRHIQKLNQKTNYNLNTRKQAFEMGWTNIFDV